MIRTSTVDIGSHSQFIVRVGVDNRFVHAGTLYYPPEILTPAQALKKNSKKSCGLHDIGDETGGAGCLRHEKGPSSGLNAHTVSRKNPLAGQFAETICVLRDRVWLLSLWVACGTMKASWPLRRVLKTYGGYDALS